MLLQIYYSYYSLLVGSTVFLPSNCLHSALRDQMKIQVVSLQSLPQNMSPDMIVCNIQIQIHILRIYIYVCNWRQDFPKRMDFNHLSFSSIGPWSILLFVCQWRIINHVISPCSYTPDPCPLDWNDGKNHNHHIGDMDWYGRYDNIYIYKYIYIYMLNIHHRLLYNQSISCPFGKNRSRGRWLGPTIYHHLPVAIRGSFKPLYINQPNNGKRTSMGIVIQQ